VVFTILTSEIASKLAIVKSIPTCKGSPKNIKWKIFDQKSRADYGNLLWKFVWAKSFLVSN
jgi:hypothetical protein